MSNAIDPDLSNFVNLSAILTGYQPSDLYDDFDPQPVAIEYLAMLKSKVDAATVSNLISTFANINAQATSTTTESEFVAEIQTQIINDAQMGPVALNIIRMWYLSIWYDMDQTPPITGLSTGTVVSMNAYTKGLAWDAGQAHPMGYSEMHFGYWETEPPPLPLPPPMTLPMPLVEVPTS